MKAIAINEFGGRDKLQFMDLPVPEIKPGEILVRVKAAGVNPVDYGSGFPARAASLPAILLDRSG